MPVRFLCTECRRLLSVSKRKVGSQVKCPKCQAAITVPAVEEAAALLAIAKTAHLSRHEPEDLPEYVGFDDLPSEMPGPTQTAAVSGKLAEEPARHSSGLCGTRH